jgi:hypothetical protein
MSENREETLYLILTDVVNSCDKDCSGDVITWRKESFCSQLEHLLKHKNSIVLKSIGDALFIIVKERKCKEILANLYCAFQSSKSINHNIRSVIHKINIGKENQRGTDIVMAIKQKNGLIDSEKVKYLISSLEEDIFGKEVNKAARIQSLPQESVIIATDDVIKAICEEENIPIDKALEEKKIDIVVEGDNYHIHTPVPIIYLKGFNDVSHINPLIVWHFSKEDVAKEAFLAQEFKARHSFRFLMEGLSGVEDMSKIRTEVLKQLRDENRISFSFYTDFYWDVFDYFELQNVNFNRLLFSDNVKSIKESKGLHIDMRLDENESIKKFYQKAKRNDFRLASVALDSYSSKTSSQVNRGIFDIKKDGENGIFIEPQTIDIFENIKINIQETDIGQGDYLLFFFRFFFDKIEDANRNFQSIYDIKDFPKNCVFPVMNGVVTGLLDSFILYKIKRDSVNEYDRFKE